MQGLPPQFFRHDALTKLGVLLTSLLCLTARPEALLRTYVGSGLDSSESRAAFGVEAMYIRPVGETAWLEGYTRVDRPFDTHENFYVPFARFTASVRALTRENFTADVRPFLSAIAIDKWNHDGARGRIGANAVTIALPHPDLTLQVELAPWFELSQYLNSPEGREFPLLGFTERLSAEGRWQKFFIEVSLSLQQSYRTLWRNDLGLQQRLGYRFSRAIGVGVAHELVSGRLDESTGYLRPVALFDDRLSRVSLFGEFVL